MNNKTTHQKLTKEMRKENLLNLKKIINDKSFEELNFMKREWGGAEIIITSDSKRVFNPETDKDDWFGRRSSCTYVLTKHSMLLSNFIYYVSRKIMDRTDFYLYHFMAFLAKDYINIFGDENPTQLLNHIFYGVAAYCKYYDWEIGNRDTVSDFMKFFLSDEELLKQYP